MAATDNTFSPADRFNQICNLRLIGEISYLICLTIGNRKMP